MIITFRDMTAFTLADKYHWFSTIHLQCKSVNGTYEFLSFLYCYLGNFNDLKYYEKTEGNSSA